MIEEYTSKFWMAGRDGGPELIAKMQQIGAKPSLLTDGKFYVPGDDQPCNAPEPFTPAEALGFTMSLDEFLEQIGHQKPNRLPQHWSVDLKCWTHTMYHGKLVSVETRLVNRHSVPKHKQQALLNVNRKESSKTWRIDGLSKRQAKRKIEKFLELMLSAKPHYQQ